jgi:hypothetical protein
MMPPGDAPHVRPSSPAESRWRHPEQVGMMRLVTSVSSGVRLPARPR